MTYPSLVGLKKVVRLVAMLGPLACGLALGNSEIRTWTLADGTTQRAEIESVDEAAKTVSLRGEDGGDRTIPLDQLSNIDRAWVLEWIEMAEELEALVKKLGGRIEHFAGKGEKMTTGFHVYHPGHAPDAAKRPLMIIFDPSGKAQRYLLRHMEAAEAAGITLVTCDYFRNGLSDEESQARFKDVLPVILKQLPHDPARVFLGGTSGGALNAFLFAAAVKEVPWAGIYSNGGWLGGQGNYQLEYPTMRVALVNGDKDTAANYWVDDDSAVLQKRGCKLALMAFEGGHQVPPPSVQLKAFKWLLGELE